jgi:hypothetical protein
MLLERVVVVSSTWEAYFKVPPMSDSYDRYQTTLGVKLVVSRLNVVSLHHDAAAGRSISTNLTL